jgi:putative peptidoglycan lipid II flippase
VTEPERPGGLLRSNLVVGVGTALSRVSGLGREIVFSGIIGLNALSDAYGGANNSPNAVYELLLGGVLSATLVPTFTRLHEEGDEDATNAIVSTVAVVLVGLTAVSVLAAPLVFRLSSFVVSDDVDPAQYRSLGTALTRIFLVQILFYGMSAVFGALLNSRRRFFAQAWAPVLSNVAIIVGLLVANAQLNGDDPYAQALADSRLRLTLGLGATIGIALMAIAQFPFLRPAGIRLRFHPDFKHPAVRRVATLSGWTFGYAGANVATVFLIKNLARPGSGWGDAYQKAYTIFQLPHGLLAMSITTTFVPELARLVARKDREGFVSRTSLGIRLVALLTFPAALTMVALRRPIVGLLLQRGPFTGEDALLASRALAGFAVGLVGFSIYLFVLRGFYAHRDTKTPFKINLVECLLNVVLAVVLVDRYGVLGLGLAFGLAYVISAAWALQILSYKVPGFDLRGLFVYLGRVLLASIVAAEVMWIVASVVGGTHGVAAVVRLVPAGVIGIGAYVGLLKVLGVAELDQLMSRFRRSTAG